MNIDYCLEECPVGIKCKEEALQKQDSVFDAVDEVSEFLIDCHKDCKENNYEVKNNG